MRLDVLGDVAEALQATVERLAAVLPGERSVRPGRRPGDLEAVTRLELVGLREGSAVLEIGLIATQRAFEALDVGVAALDSFGVGLEALANGTGLPTEWDAGVLDSVDRLLRVLDRGIDAVGVRTPGRSSEITLTRETREALRRRIESPLGRRWVEVEGRLLMADFGGGRDQARIDRPLKPVAGRSFWSTPSLEELAAEHVVRPIGSIDELVADFWPADETLDEFLAASGNRD